MNAKTKAAAQVDTSLASIVTVVFLGLGVLFVAGFANSAVLHDTAHDTRHAVGFPCH